MKLSALIKKRYSGRFATANPAIPATDGTEQTGTVATIATLAVAKSSGRGVEATPEAQTQNRQAVGFAADPVVVPDPAGALNRPLCYLLEPDDRLEGLCLMIDADIDDIRSGRLPLASARLYMEREESKHPHLAERLRLARMADNAPDKMPDNRHPLEIAIERLQLDGLDLHNEDARFIKAKIGTRKDWPTLLQAYAERWLLAAATEPAPHKRQNVGRRSANAWLLEVTR